MDRKDLINDIKNRTGISEEDTKKIVDTYIKIAKEELKKNDYEKEDVNLVRGEDNETW